MIMKTCLVVIGVLSFFVGSGQRIIMPITDTLSNKDYAYFNSRYDLDIEGQEVLEAYTTAHLAKAKKEGNYVEMVNAYKSKLHSSEKNLQLVFADSMILAASRSDNSKILGGAYLTKGMVLYSLKRYTQALDYYLKANTELEYSGDRYLIHKMHYNIALIKYYMEDYPEAVATLKDCINYFADESEHAYLQSLHFLGLCYSGMGDFRSSAKTNKFGMEEEFRLRNMALHHCFLHSEGVNHYFLGNYEQSIKSLQKSLPDLISRHDFANESVAYFYMAKSYLAKDGIEKALPYLYKVDSLYNKYDYLRPDMRETYQLLIGYFKAKDDLSSKLQYMKKLIAVDAMLHKNYKYLSGKIYRQYDTRIQLRENEKTQTTLAERSVLALLLGIVSAVLLFIMVLIWRRYRKTRLLYLQHFNLLMEQRKLPQEATSKSIETKELGISTDIVEAVLKRLRRFEETRKYLDKDLTLVRLSTYLNSNSNYVSKIIFHYTSKRYLEYITDLRLDYIIDLLEKLPLYRNYTYAALAAEAGFLTAKHFSKAFLKKTGMPLHFFIKELKERANSDENDPIP